MGEEQNDYIQITQNDYVNALKIEHWAKMRLLEGVGRTDSRQGISGRGSPANQAREGDGSEEQGHFQRLTHLIWV